ncbi:hypothetical protein NP284_04580 [Rhodopseudomonas pseudopalustris]|uniref:hypothetical protein n=1 Tax=Rhodopseudomonas pseudopalustris TaxID=1513892 RepID=UPI000C9F587F
MLRTTTIATVLLLAAGGMSLAQTSSSTSTGTRPPASDPSISGTPLIGNAPIGHRQPRRNPELESSETTRDPADVVLDRKIRSICRGC